MAPGTPPVSRRHFLFVSTSAPAYNRAFTICSIAGQRAGRLYVYLAAGARASIKALEFCAGHDIIVEPCNSYHTWLREGVYFEKRGRMNSKLPRYALGRPNK